MKVHITNYNSSKIIQSLDLNKIDIDREVYHIDFKFFSDYEIKYLLSFRMLYERPEKFFECYVKQNITDSLKYVFAEHIPAYHKSYSCTRLLSDFNNYKLPKEIINKGTIVVHQYRQYFMEVFRDETDIQIALEKIRVKFDLSEDPKKISFKNSGHSDHINIELYKLENEIDALIFKANQYYLSSPDIKYILDKYGKITFRHQEMIYFDKLFKDERFIQTIITKLEDEYKKPLKILLKEYYRVKYNPELKFENTLLEQIGFVLCKSCRYFSYEDQNNIFFVTKCTFIKDNRYVVKFENFIPYYDNIPSECYYMFSSLPYDINEKVEIFFEEFTIKEITTFAEDYILSNKFLLPIVS
jgi:hypothetical protein